MFLQRKAAVTEDGLQREVKKMKVALEEAQGIVIGAGAGLSTSAGFEYGGTTFRRYFSDFEKAYGFHDMYSGGFYPYHTPEEYWAYWSLNILVNRYQNAPKPVYEALLRLVRNKDYFVLTTNVDHCFQKAGFEKERLFYTQGDYGLFQCSKPCHQKTYDNEMLVRRMVREQKELKIPSELVPCCPVCGRPMIMNLRSDQHFVEDEGWHRAAERYQVFLDRHKDRKILFLELGTGMNTPGIIKYNFWRMTYEWKDAAYVCINLGEAYAPAEIRMKSLCINRDIGEVLESL